MNKIAKFEKVSYEQFKKDAIKVLNLSEDDEVLIKSMYEDIKIPVRSTKGSAGYDISTPVGVQLDTNDNIVIPTGLRCQIEEGYVMMIYPRSSMGIKKHMFISNTTPIIDSDYYNSDNEGHIFVAIESRDKEIQLNEGERFVQAIFVPYGIADDEVTAERTGGIGSTGV